MDARAPAIAKDKPLIFSAPMIAALLAGRKTQTRRLLVPQPYQLVGRPGSWNASGCVGGRIAISDSELLSLHRYVIGDRFYVKEAWRTCAGLDDKSPSEIGAACLEAGYSEPWGPVRYEADGARRAWTASDWPTEEAGRLRSPIHMPRWASRLTLLVTDVRVERLADISEEDAIAEGVVAFAESEDRPGSWEGLSEADRLCMTRVTYGSAKRAFQHIWERLHGPDGWAANPFVCVIGFEPGCESGWKPRKVAKTFGFWKVRGYDESAHRWVCTCRCGSIRRIESKHLMSGSSRGCFDCRSIPKDVPPSPAKPLPSRHYVPSWSKEPVTARSGR